MPKTRSPWLVFLAKRLAGLAGVLIVLIAGTFFMVKLIPGDPAQIVAGPNAEPAQVELIRHDLGLDQPLHAQFLSYISNLASGDLGQSFFGKEPVADIIAARLPFTAQLAIAAIALVLLISIPLGMSVGIACRGGRRRKLDVGFTAVTSFFGAIPEYVLAVLLIVLLALTWQVFPPGGAETPSAMVLPVLAISLGPLCALARIVRRETSVVLSQDYMRTARSRRLRGFRLYTRHALPNLLTSTLTLGGLILAGLLGGTIVVETAFHWPGVGTRIMTAIFSRDYPVLQGLVLVLGLLATVINLLVDVVLAMVDPRTLAGKAGSR